MDLLTKVVLHIETAEHISDNSELTLSFVRLQQLVQERYCPLCITLILSNIGFIKLLANGNEEMENY